MSLLLIYVVIFGAKASLAWWYASRYPIPRGCNSRPSVTICQAIMSGDPDLERVLTDNLTALAPAGFIWLIDDGDVEAARATKAAKGAHPRHQIQIISCQHPPDGVNPKLFKLAEARKRVKLGIFVVLDDDTRLTASSLDALTDALGRGELATGLPFYRDGTNFFGRLLAQFVNNNAALTYLPTLPFSMPVSINGMCYALDVETLTRIRNFEPIMRNLTDDLAVAEQIRAMGGRIIQTPYPQEVATTVDTVSRYFTQMHRWYLFALLLMRRQSAGLNVFICAVYGLPPVLLIMGIVELLIHCSLASFCVLIAALGTRTVVLRLLQRRLTGLVRHRFVPSLLSELLQPIHLCHAILDRSIRWRTRRYRVYSNDHFVSQ